MMAIILSKDKVKMTIKVFVSCPMKGLDREQIIKVQKDTFDKFVNEYGIKSIDYQLMDTCMNLNVPSDIPNTSLYYFGHSIVLMSEANLVLFAVGWKDARGCVLEHEIATKYDIPTFEF